MYSLFMSQSIMNAAFKPCLIQSFGGLEDKTWHEEQSEVVSQRIPWCVE